MNGPRKTTVLVLIALAAGLLLFVLPALGGVFNTGQPDAVLAQSAGCTPLDDPGKIPSPILINFDDLADASVIASHYLTTFGVNFEDSALTRALIYGQPNRSGSFGPKCGQK